MARPPAGPKASGSLREGDHQAWLPWDTPAAVRGFLSHFQPSAGVLMETEVWPNLVAQCQRTPACRWRWPTRA